MAYGTSRLIPTSVEGPTTKAWISRPCPLCGSTCDGPVFAESNIALAKLDAFAFASRKVPEYMHPRLIDCRECGLLFGNPVLSADTLARAYETADFDSGTEANYAGRTYAGYLRKIIARLPDLDGALDIGAGDGAFVEQLIALGFQNVTGVEPSEAPIAAAKPDVRPLIRKGLFRPEEFPANRFSLITCFQTMEHVWDPLELARGALGLLKPGGAFLIVVHNRQALSAKLLGLKSPIFDVEHLQLFSPKSARELLLRAGFRLVSTSAIWNRYPIHYWIKLLPLPPNAKNKLLAWLGDSLIGKTPIPLPAGNLFCCGFRQR